MRRLGSSMGYRKDRAVLRSPGYRRGLEVVSLPSLNAFHSSTAAMLAFTHARGNRASGDALFWTARKSGLNTTPNNQECAETAPGVRIGYTSSAMRIKRRHKSPNQSVSVVTAHDNHIPSSISISSSVGIVRQGCALQSRRKMMRVS